MSDQKKISGLFSGTRLVMLMGYEIFTLSICWTAGGDYGSLVVLTDFSVLYLFQLLQLFLFVLKNSEWHAFTV